MDQKTRLKLGLWVGLVLVGLGLGYSAVVSSAERAEKALAPLAPDGILFPPDHAVLLSGSFDVICNGDDAPLEVNGKSYEWEPFQAPLHVARVRLSPGVYDLTVGKQKREIVVALNEDEHDGPEDWSIHRYHKIDRDPERCGECHQTKKQEGRMIVGELRSPEACLECHDVIEFDVTHAHPLEPIEHCEMCHSLHGSPRKGLLKAPVKKLCNECHDA
ncbi:MAG: hypothetical protein HQ582_06215 [Planctomycetes bacterium]|nr:hypothetical protein [Planctomycetota bacterium]